LLVLCVLIEKTERSLVDYRFNQWIAIYSREPIEDVLEWLVLYILPIAKCHSVFRFAKRVLNE